MPTSNTRMMLFAALVLVAWCPPSTGHSAALPSTITSHTTTSTDDSLPSSGTTLNVQAMLDDAAANNRSEAVFNATRLTFGGTLTVTLPNTAAAWTTRNIPLRVVIQDGASDASAPWPTTFIKVTGVLALGSNITVQGGSYDFATQFVNLPFGLTIQDGSTLAIEGGTFRAHYPTSGTDTSLIKCSVFSLTLANAGTLSVSHNTVLLASVSVTGEWWSQVLYMDKVPLTVSASSILTLSHNDVSVTHISTSVNSWLWSTLLGYKCTMTVTGNSTLSILHSQLNVSGVNAGGFLFWNVLQVRYSDITVSYSSRLLIGHSNASITEITCGGFHICDLHPVYSSLTIHTNSSATVSNVVVDVTQSKSRGFFSIASVYLAYTGAFATIHASSTMTIANNSATISDVTAGDECTWWSLISRISPTTVTASSRIIISNNSLDSLDVFVSGYARWGVMHAWNYPLTITDSSSFAISNIRVTVLNLKAAGLHWVGVLMDLPHTPNTIRTSSSLSISGIAVDLNNVVVSDNLIWNVLRMKSTSSTISSSSTISIADNSLSLINVNTKQGSEWYGLYATDSPIDITSSSNLSFSKNGLTTSTVIGPMAANVLIMAGTGASGLGGIRPTTGVCGRSMCRDADTEGVYICGYDMLDSGDSNSQEHTFTCTLPSTPQLSPTSTTATESPQGGDTNQNEDFWSLEPSSLIVLIVISVIILAFCLAIAMMIYVCCLKKNQYSTLGDAGGANENVGDDDGDAGNGLEMTSSRHEDIPAATTPSNPFHDIGNSNTVVDDVAVQPVLGVAVETPSHEPKAVSPYDGGGCYQ